VNIHDILLKKAQSQGLGHFYIVEGHEALNFVQTFIRDYYSLIENFKYSSHNLLDFPDVFVLGNTGHEEEKENKPFTVVESETLSRFFEFKPVQNKRKFAVITEASRITNMVANKWLKLLEEPQGESTIFLLNPDGKKLMDTIHSRAIHLRLKNPITVPDETEWNDFISQVKEKSLVQFLETFSRGEIELSTLISKCVLWESKQIGQLDAKKALEDWIKNYQEMDTFHQPTATKWTLFYSYLNQYVLPRASH